LGKSVNLIVVPTGKSQQFGDEFFQPSGALGKSDGSSGEQAGLGNQARTPAGMRTRKAERLEWRVHT
jgi:hypothetical protein